MFSSFFAFSKNENLSTYIVVLIISMSNEVIIIASVNFSLLFVRSSIVSKTQAKLEPRSAQNLDRP